MSDAEQIDALAFHLMTALDKIDELNAANEELRVKNVMYRRQLQFADDALQMWSEKDGLG